MLKLKLPPEQRIVLKCFNHWVMWNKVRKIMKYYLRLSNCSVQYIKCDMRKAFDRWKKNDYRRIETLMSKPVAHSMAINIKQSDILFKLADEEAKCNVVLKDLNTQRDELLIRFV